MSLILGHVTAVAGERGMFHHRGHEMLPGKKELEFLGKRVFFRAREKNIDYSKVERNPLVGPWNTDIVALARKEGWLCLPKYYETQTALRRINSCPGYSAYDYEQSRSSCCGENMHVEWENVMNTLAERERIPKVIALAKSSHRSCLPCLRLGVAYSFLTKSCYIIEDMAASSGEGAFHFFLGGEYIPIPKERIYEQQSKQLKLLLRKLLENDQTGIEEAVEQIKALNLPVDSQAKNFYEKELEGFVQCQGMLENHDVHVVMKIVNAEHFARLIAEYSACVFRTDDAGGKNAMILCRKRVKSLLLNTWREHWEGDKALLQEWIQRSCSSVLPDDADGFNTVLGSYLHSKSQKQHSILDHFKKVSAAAGAAAATSTTSTSTQNTTSTSTTSASSPGAHKKRKGEHKIAVIDLTGDEDD